MIRSFFVLLLAATLSVPGAARADLSFSEQASDMLSSVYPDDAPGAAVVVSRNGEVIYEQALGLADVELEVALEPDQVFRLASVTKQYAAAALLKLVEEGKVALDDPLARFLPDFPVGSATIVQLLNHTSGIKSYTGIEGYMTSHRARRDLTTAELVAVFADEPVDFDPGEGWSYNNSGYVLVGAVIEAVTGQPWNRYLRDSLLLPNGIERTDAYPDFALVPGRVEGYDGPVDEPQRAPYLSMTQPHAAGALMATAADVDRWQVALHGGKVLGDDLYNRMISPEGAAEEANYGFGIGVQEWFGQKALSHGGGIFGFTTHALYLPQERLSVVVLANRAGPGWSTQDIALRLAGLATGRAYPIEEAAIGWSARQLAQVQGTYRIDDQEIRTFRVEGGTLISQRNGGQEFKVYPIAGDRLAFEASLSAFLIERNDAGEVVAVALQSPWGGEPERAGKISDEVRTRAAIDVPVEQLERLIGRYELQPGFVMTARVNDGQLEIQATGQPAIAMQAESPTRFFSAQVGADIEFELPESGPASSLTLYQGGQALPAPRISEDGDRSP
ncbi:serine hydrolase [Wenzhouxiangella sp. XN79A]|uniref:serine hydrolase n=1 Tax=Wenzhouxiangella sp. XN79A TaxID=2724193 RepID=UPI00144AE292|nr:serine hydrolase [Wenzhouxiangella sp. XN79A]NKI34768.1 serine hydrolase [Wenzhouxiangella sp. XN79A]